MEFKIVYEDDTALAEFEAQNRGCRKDIIVIIGEKKYKVHVISMIRLQQDYEAEKKEWGHYISVPNTLIVQEVTKKEIEAIITKMFYCNYFEQLNNYGF